jgi:tRNA-specific 2-thiouridylase
MTTEFNRFSTIAVAMSGGVDSSVAACLLKDARRKVIGITAVMATGQLRCKGSEGVRMARGTPGQLGIPHYVLDLHEDFEQEVLEYFVDEYVSGRTPSPCGICNSRIKFGILMERARELGADALATGHYARTTRDAAGHVHLLKGADMRKDQSYFLFRLTQEQLAGALFPLGDMVKTDVIRYAEEKKLVARKSIESQELCFVEDDNHGRWIESYRPGVARGGEIVDVDGRKLGEHRGIYHYTLGQRRGLGIATGSPMYVVGIDATSGRITVGDRSRIMKRKMKVDGINWISGTPPSGTFSASTRIRYNHEPADSNVIVEGKDAATIEFAVEQFAITPGQIAVFYNGDELVGGGWIREAL